MNSNVLSPEPYPSSELVHDIIIDNNATAGYQNIRKPDKSGLDKLEISFHWFIHFFILLSD